MVISPQFRVNPWIALLILTLGFFMIQLDTAIVTIAVPSIEHGLNAGFDEILWVLNGYLVTYAVLLITAGRLGDMFGPRRVFIAGIALFTLSSAACGLSQTAGQLIAFRALQGVGGAMLSPQTLALIPTLFPEERRGAAYAIWGSVGGVAIVPGRHRERGAMLQGGTCRAETVSPMQNQRTCTAW